MSLKIIAKTVLNCFASLHLKLSGVILKKILKKKLKQSFIYADTGITLTVPSFHAFLFHLKRLTLMSLHFNAYISICNECTTLFPAVL